MSEQTKAIETAETADTLGGIPGLGPARRAMLIAAGITSRPDLVATTVEQLISLTGMPRVQAEKALAAVHITQEQVILPPLMPAEEAASEETEPSLDVVGSVLSLQTAISDTTRILGKKGGLTKSLTRFAVILERLPELLASLGPKRQTRLVEHLAALTKRLKKVAARPEALKPARAKRLRERLKSERQTLASVSSKTKSRGKNRGTQQ